MNVEMLKYMRKKITITKSKGIYIVSGYGRPAYVPTLKEARVHRRRWILLKMRDEYTPYRKTNKLIL